MDGRRLHFSRNGIRPAGTPRVRAAIIAGRESVEVRNVDLVLPGPGQVAVAIARAGICGSDLHLYFGRWRPDRVAPGHELAGRIVAVGEGVDARRVGQRVTAECFGRCGACEWCRSGRYNHCENLRWDRGGGHGALAEQAIVHASALHDVEGLSDEQAVLAEPLAVGVRAAYRLGQSVEGPVAVIGAGTIGLMSALAATALGIRSLTLFARHPHQVEIARRLGIAGARLAQPEKSERYPWIIDSVATTQSLATAIEQVSPMGRIVVVGCLTLPSRLNLGTLFAKEAELVGSTTYATSRDQPDFDTALSWLRCGRVDPTPVVTHRFTLDRAADAFRTAADKSTGAVKVLVQP